MQKLLLALLLFISLVTIPKSQVGIGTERPHESAAFDIKAIDKGLLIPRLRITQKENIYNPAFGLMIFQIDQDSVFYFLNGSRCGLVKTIYQVNSDWYASSGVTQILNKPQLSNLALTGNFSDFKIMI